MAGAPTGGQPAEPAGTRAPRAYTTPATMTASYEMPLDSTARRFRRPMAVGLLLSVALHVAVVLAAGRIGSIGAAIAGDRTDRPRPRVERLPSDALHAVAVRAVKTEIRVPAPPAEVRATPVELEAAEPREEAFAGSSLGPPPGGEGGPSRPGGPAAGRPAETPPVPRSVIPEWDAPDAVRGRTVTVRVHVDSAGRPTGAVELEPPTPHEGFNRKLTETVRAMRFSPARTPGGRPVAAWAELTFSF